MSPSIVNPFVFPVVAPPPPSSPTLLGVGSTSTSLTDYPKTGAVTTGDIWVDPTAVTNGTGTEVSPYNNLNSAFSAVSDGERIIVKAGTLTPTSNFYATSAYPTGIEIFNYGTDRPIIDASALGTGSASWTLRFGSSSTNVHWKGFEIINNPEYVIVSEGTNIKLEDLWIHHCTQNVGGQAPVRIQNSALNNIIQDCAVWRIGDGTSVSSNAPDCYQATHSTSGSTTSGHKFVRCFAGHGSDDGFDLFRASNAQIIDCVAYKGGYYWNGTSAGDGSGFKMGGGGSAGIGNNIVKGSIAIECKSEAFKPNSSPEPITALNCTSYDAVGYGFNFSSGDGVGDKHVVTNCIDYLSGTAVGMNPTYVTATYNTWNLGITNPLFAAPASFDYSLASGSPAIGAANPSGNLGASTVALEIAKEWLAKDLT